MRRAVEAHARGDQTALLRTPRSNSIFIRPKWKHPPTMIERLCAEAKAARRAIEAHVRGDQTTSVDCPQ